jgi:hypothetical protein
MLEPPFEHDILRDATLGALLIGEPSIAEVDLNPVIVYPRGRGVMALDALLQVS